jgi:hypothetical protein
MFKYGIGLIKEDEEQMPGVFLLKDRKIADELDYLRLAGAG